MRKRDERFGFKFTHTSTEEHGHANTRAHTHTHQRHKTNVCQQMAAGHVWTEGKRETREKERVNRDEREKRIAGVRQATTGGV